MNYSIQMAIENAIEIYFKVFMVAWLKKLTIQWIIQS
jgi:hypothetical protein